MFTSLSEAVCQEFPLPPSLYSRWRPTFSTARESEESCHILSKSIHQARLNENVLNTIISPNIKGRMILKLCEIIILILNISWEMVQILVLLEFWVRLICSQIISPDHHNIQSSDPQKITKNTNVMEHDSSKAWGMKVLGIPKDCSKSYLP